MARSIMEVAFLGTQKTEVEGAKYVKVFYGDEPDGKTEHGLSIVGMAAADEVADEVFFAGSGFAPLETVRITFEVARGGQNKGKNLALHIEPVKARPAASTAPAASQAAPQKPDTK
ncbi:MULTISPECIES: hypothetical protein [unclassified Pseudomonas]|uniref:hypothetical protein n=1 Tax=unclassified Pseudomonas TaxID=196821 RepID=UPI0024491840|nr:MULTISPECIES: hypothetical protein [unclassified Pseudomonas]MDG9931019.1 hypothetical protein [Pseudomonas sp. GD04042]MDH0485389.1 hypothetical protein [Pseudomonas sp. GD04015]MDH0605080.1 hypothetical protein [Pseudomonas sp. GD03869]